MKKTFTLFVALLIMINFSGTVFAQQNNQDQSGNQQNENAEGEPPKINLIIETFSIINPTDVHLRELIDAYLSSAEANPAILSGDLINALAEVNPRKFTLSKRTMFNSLLYNMLNLAIENKGSIDTESLSLLATQLLQGEHDVLILGKAVELYGVVAQEQDEEKQFGFARDTLYMLRRMISKSDKYSSASLIQASIPHVTKIMNKRIATNPGMMSIILYLYNSTTVRYAEDVLKQLYFKAVDAAIS